MGGLERWIPLYESGSADVNDDPDRRASCLFPICGEAEPSGDVDESGLSILLE